MIIFDLDGTLANCEHRRHFVDCRKRPCACDHMCSQCENWIPDWKAFYEACNEDKPILPVFSFFNTIRQYTDVQIWSGRCESVKEKTIDWFLNKVPIRPTYWNKDSWNHVLKMRPIGDYTPDDQLKERWLDEYIASMWPKLEKPTKENMEKVYHRKDPIDFVFDARPNVVSMWRRRGIFVFDVNQSGEEF